MIYYQQQKLLAHSLSRFCSCIQIRLFDSATNNYLVNLEECKRAIQNPLLLKESVAKIYELSTKRQADEGQQKSLSSSEIDSNNSTLLYLEKKTELEELTRENSALTAKFKTEKDEQIEANAALLKKISMKTSGTRRRSTIFKC